MKCMSAGKMQGIYMYNIKTHKSKNVEKQQNTYMYI